MVTKTSLLKQMEELIEEPGLTCCICREGYKFQVHKQSSVWDHQLVSVFQSIEPVLANNDGDASAVNIKNKNITDVLHKSRDVFIFILKENRFECLKSIERIPCVQNSV